MQAKIDVVSAEDYDKLVKEKSDNAIDSRKQKEQAPAASPAPAPVAIAPVVEPAPAPIVTALNR